MLDSLAPPASCGGPPVAQRGTRTQSALLRGASGAARTRAGKCALAQVGARRTITKATDGGASPVVKEVGVLGGEDFIYSQRSGVEDDLYKGSKLGIDADVATVEFRSSDLRALANLPSGFEPPARFLDRVALHVAKNAFQTQIGGRTPLILGIWGHKGCGKSFNLELSCAKMGVQPIVISAGELEDEWAGGPGRKLRERYRTAARIMAGTGQATCLIINDMDIGVGQIADTQNTVNSQNLQGTLMAICDDPERVPAGEEGSTYAAAAAPLPRIPIFVTANDLSRLYAPLIRDGRMDKFYWEPSDEEMDALVSGLFAPDLSAREAGALRVAFPRQPLDFFGAIKSRMADTAVREWVHATQSIDGDIGVALMGGEATSDRATWHMREKPGLGRDLAITLDGALACGASLAREQQAVMDLNLAKEYMNTWDVDVENLKHVKEAAAREAALSAPMAPPPDTAKLAGAREALARGNVEREEERLASGYYEMIEEAESKARAEEEAQAEEPRDWAVVDADAVHAVLYAGTFGAAAECPAGLEGARVVDARCIRDHEWGNIKGAVSVPAVLALGTKITPESAPNPEFAAELLELCKGDLNAPVVVYGGGGEAEGEGEGCLGRDAAAAAHAAGFTAVHELLGGYPAWDLDYQPNGKRRERGKWADQSSGELEFWTASN